ncbi:hypothetical protein [Oceanobacillus oncorhynchi]|uniref:hypothetical protein n=1 Tax=Oceanobacillus oncorhynchi TaxID=545501 RepID=UPI002F96325A
MSKSYLQTLEEDYLRIEHENQRYKEALEFYANGINYQVFIENGKSNIEHDGGSKARRELKGEST